MGYAFAIIVFALSSRNPRALLALVVTFLLGLYIFVQVRLHEVRVKLEQQQHAVEPPNRPTTHSFPATPKRTRGRE